MKHPKIDELDKRLAAIKNELFETAVARKKFGAEQIFIEYHAKFPYGHEYDLEYISEVNNTVCPESPTMQHAISIYWKVMKPKCLICGADPFASKDKNEA